MEQRTTRVAIIGRSSEDSLRYRRSADTTELIKCFVVVSVPAREALLNSRRRDAVDFSAIRTGNPYSNEHSVTDMDEIVLVFIKTIELIFDLVETIYRRFFSDDTDDDKQSQSGIDDVQ
ncbi:hypothetical protein [Natrialba sp. PRR66]|uniref:hypothetical protein n=1 Tax=Natrialba sp. PRR66 TaxID=3098146 RepID=UPI002B1E545B|nr:hypothetical protein [Natrialba sp. PRR66]